MRHGPAPEPAALIADAQLVAQRPDEEQVELRDPRLPVAEVRAVDEQDRDQHGHDHPGPEAVVQVDEEGGQEHDHQVDGDEPQQPHELRAEQHCGLVAAEEVDDGRQDREEGDEQREPTGQAPPSVGEVMREPRASLPHLVDDEGIREAPAHEERGHRHEGPR